MIKSFVLLTSLVLTIAFPFETKASSCIDIFKRQNEEIVQLGQDNIELSGIKIIRDTSPQEIKSKKDPGYRQSLKNLLMMLTETQFENISRKDMLQNGDLRLGKTFDDGLSLEFVYEGDIRGNNDFFHLKKIKLIKPNGQDEKIDENPVPDIGRPEESRTIVVKKETGEDATSRISTLDKEIVEQLFTKKELQTPDVQKKVELLTAKLKEVKVPFKIEGVLLEGLRTWSGLVQHVKRPQMREQINKDQITRLLWQARAVGSIRWMGQQLNRMIFRDVIRNAVLVGLAYNLVGPNLMDRTPTPQVAATAQAQVINRDSQVIDFISDLAKKEVDQKGSALIYTGSTKDSKVLMTAQTKDSNSIISLFPKQQTIVIITDSKNPIVLNRADDQKAYDFIASQMENLYADRR